MSDKTLVSSDELLNYYDDGSLEWKDNMLFSDKADEQFYVYAVEEDSETKIMISRDRKGK